MIYEHQGELCDRIEAVSGRHIPAPPIFEDTTCYQRILGGSVLRLGGADYFVLGDHVEGRFGLDEQPKLWVKRAVELETGRPKIIKLVFHESFTAVFGDLRVYCRRSAAKESRVLELVRGHPHYMQGGSVDDTAGNLVRIIDLIEGESLYERLLSLELAHDRYCEEVLPGLMREVIAAIEALEQLHRMGLQHGDIRNDHLLIERDSGRLLWIDFDYEVDFAGFDLMSLGNILTFVAGRGINSFHGVRNGDPYPGSTEPLDEGDALLFYRYRVANLRKLFPHLPRELNDVLLRFSVGSHDRYRDLGGLLEDLRAIYGR